MSFLRQAWTGQFTRRPCGHLDMVNDVQPASEVYGQGVAFGDNWPALRMWFDLWARRVL